MEEEKGGEKYRGRTSMESIYNPPYLASEAQVEITQPLLTAQHQCHSDQ